MSENTKIEWTDHSWNPWRGCTKVSAGCANCYAETLSRRNPAVLGEWGKGKPRVLAKNWNDPVKWNRRPWVCPNGANPMPGAPGGHGPYCGDVPTIHCCECGETLRRTTVFPSLCDWLDEEVPVEWLARFLKLIHDTPDLTWLLLTKRPENWYGRMMAALWSLEGLNPWDDGDSEDLPATEAGSMVNDWLGNTPPRNVWIGTSIEDQANADRRIPKLLKIPAVGRFLSLEPLLGPVDAVHAVNRGECGSMACAKGKVDWLIIGGESGHGARPCNVEWIRSLVKQGKEAGVATFVKQLGGYLAECRKANLANVLSVKQDAIQTIHPKGGDPAEWPEDLRVREFPEGLR